MGLGVGILMDRKLETEPAWRDVDVGRRLPDSDHACSVCLPTWQSVIGYEEGADEVLGKMQAGYPRFFLNEWVKRTQVEARQVLGLNRSGCLPFPSRESARRAQRFVERQAGQAGRLESWDGVHFLVIPEGEPMMQARRYWRFTGEIVSSRTCEDLLDDCLMADSTVARKRVKAALAEVHGFAAEHTFLFPTGMAALFAAYREVLSQRPGLPTLQLEFPYTDLYQIQAHFGVGVDFPDLRREGEWNACLGRIEQGIYSAVFSEVPSNPLCRCVDIPRLSEVCRKANTPLVLDDTIASPVNVEVRPYADIVTNSLTKWHGAGGDVMAGALWVNPEQDANGHWLEKMGQLERECGLYGRDAELLAQRVMGVTERVQRVNATSEAIFELLAQDERVSKVWYPKITTAGHYEAIRREGGGYGGLVSFELKDKKSTPRFYDALRVSKGPSLGTNFSLACPYTLLAHYTELDWVKGYGLTRNLIRLSVGQEDVNDLKARLEEALAT